MAPPGKSSSNILAVVCLGKENLLQIKPKLMARFRRQWT
jgi:hypothetical protein